MQPAVGCTCFIFKRWQIVLQHFACVPKRPRKVRVVSSTVRASLHGCLQTIRKRFVHFFCKKTKCARALCVCSQNNLCILCCCLVNGSRQCALRFKSFANKTHFCGPNGLQNLALFVCRRLGQNIGLLQTISQTICVCCWQFANVCVCLANLFAKALLAKGMRIVSDNSCSFLLRQCANSIANC